MIFFEIFLDFSVKKWPKNPYFWSFLLDFQHNLRSCEPSDHNGQQNRCTVIQYVAKTVQNLKDGQISSETRTKVLKWARIAAPTIEWICRSHLSSFRHLKLHIFSDLQSQNLRTNQNLENWPENGQNDPLFGHFLVKKSIFRAINHKSAKKPQTYAIVSTSTRPKLMHTNPDSLRYSEVLKFTIFIFHLRMSGNRLFYYRIQVDLTNSGQFFAYFLSKNGPKLLF